MLEFKETVTMFNVQSIPKSFNGWAHCLLQAPSQKSKCLASIKIKKRRNPLFTEIIHRQKPNHNKHERERERWMDLLHHLQVSHKTNGCNNFVPYFHQILYNSTFFSQFFAMSYIFIILQVDAFHINQNKNHAGMVEIFVASMTQGQA